MVERLEAERSLRTSRNDLITSLRGRGWFDGQLDHDPAKLVLIDETSRSSKTTRLRG